MRRPRAVADTNVWVAAAITPQGVCGRLVDMAIDEHWRPVASPLLVAEVEQVLSRATFRRWLGEDEAARFVADVRAIADVIDDPEPSPGPHTSDPDDEFLVTLVQTADVAASVSGDPHLTGLVDLEPPVLTPAAFLTRLETD